MRMANPGLQATVGNDSGVPGMGLTHEYKNRMIIIFIIVILMTSVIMCANLPLFRRFICGEFEELPLLILDIILTHQVCLCLAFPYFTLPVFSYS